MSRFNYVQRLMKFKTGRRSDSAHAYIHSTRAVHSNLHLQCNTKVDKVIMEDGKAVGVRTVPTKPLHPSVSNKTPLTNRIDTSSPKQQHSRTFRARKMIVISGGTLSSPLILQRSGIGDPEKLQKAGVKPIVDLPGVGLNFQDHYLTFSTFRAKPGKPNRLFIVERY
jgi:alcohol oxidase